MTTSALIGIVIGVILLIVTIVLLLWVMITYKALIKSKNKVDESFNLLNESFKNRYEEVLILAQNAKRYFVENKNVLSDLISMRNQAMASKNQEEQLKNESFLSEITNQILEYLNNVSSIEKDKVVCDLQETFYDINDKININCKNYNVEVEKYNLKIKNKVLKPIAKWFGFSKYALYKQYDKEVCLD